MWTPTPAPNIARIAPAQAVAVGASARWRSEKKTSSLSVPDATCLGLAYESIQTEVVPGGSL